MTSEQIICAHIITLLSPRAHCLPPPTPPPPRKPKQPHQSSPEEPDNRTRSHRHKREDDGAGDHGGESSDSQDRERERIQSGSRTEDSDRARKHDDRVSKDGGDEVELRTKRTSVKPAKAPGSSSKARRSRSASPLPRRGHSSSSQTISTSDHTDRRADPRPLVGLLLAVHWTTADEHQRACGLRR